MLSLLRFWYSFFPIDLVKLSILLSLWMCVSKQCLQIFNMKLMNMFTNLLPKICLFPSYQMAAWTLPKATVGARTKKFDKKFEAANSPFPSSSRQYTFGRRPVCMISSFKLNHYNRFHLLIPMCVYDLITSHWSKHLVDIFFSGHLLFHSRIYTP